VRSILARAQRAELLAYATGRTLYAFDFDGTLAPIVADPKRAALRAPTRRLLGRLAALRPCAVISGRSLADLRPRLADLEVRLLVGNHGAEWHDEPLEPLVRAPVAAWRDHLHQHLGDVDGVVVEDKGSSLAVHYRGARDRAHAERRVHAASRGLPKVRLVPGKCVLNLVPAQAPHKGEALIDACRRLRCASAIFVGDDVTDEDVFQMKVPRGLRVLGVRVGKSASSRAKFYVRGQAEMDELLKVLLGRTEG
jgi:trehalose 6-phosphate phosphatase